MNLVRQNARPGQACYAALGETKSPKVRYAKDGKIAKLQFNKAGIEENSFPREKRVGNGVRLLAT